MMRMRNTITFIICKQRNLDFASTGMWRLNSNCVTSICSNITFVWLCIKWALQNTFSNYRTVTNAITAHVLIFICVEVLRPSQPKGMSSAVSLHNHAFTGQAFSSKRLTSIVHILSPETDNFPS